MNFIARLKNKWGIESNWQFLIINVVFAITGSLTVFIRRPIFALFDLEKSDPFWHRAITYLLTVTPAYLIMLIVIATIFGQRKFFWEFEKRFLGRIIGKKKND